MGYWSTHPMGGDSPLDVRCYIGDYIQNLMKQDGIIPEEENYFNNKDNGYITKYLNLYKTNLVNNFMDYIKEEEPYYKNYGFVVPFVLLEFEIRFDNEDEIKKLKELVADGGGYERGYCDEEKDSPIRIANIVKNHIQVLFNSKYNIEDVKKQLSGNELENLFDMGVLFALEKAISENSEGLINKN